MGFKVKIDAKETIELGPEIVQKVTFETNTPNDSNARSRDLGMSLRIEGKVLTGVKGTAADQTIKMLKWALVPAEEAECYGKVIVDVISSNVVVRQMTFDAAYVVDYKEKFVNETGVGTFSLLVRQKKDLNDKVKYEGGFNQ